MPERNLDARAVCFGSAEAVPDAAGGGGRAAGTTRAPRSFIERIFAYPSPEGSLRAGMAARRAREVPHGAQDGAPRALGDSIQSPGPPGRQRPGDGQTWAAVKCETAFMSTLSIAATIRRHTNVLSHMLATLKKHLDSESGTEDSAGNRGLSSGSHFLSSCAHTAAPSRFGVSTALAVILRVRPYLTPDPRELMLRYSGGGVQVRRAGRNLS